MYRVAELAGESVLDQGGRVDTGHRVARARFDASGRCIGVVVQSTHEFVPCDYLIIAADPLAAARILGKSRFADIERENSTGYFTGSAGRLNLIAARPLSYASVAAELTAMGRSTLVVTNCSFQGFEDAYDQCRSGVPARAPYMEIFSPSEVDSRASCGAHAVVSAYLLHLPYHQKGRQADIFAGYEAGLISYLDSLDNGFADGISEVDFLTPRELEEELNLPGGHPDHGHMELSHLFERRPVGRLSGGQTIFDNVFLCSAGIHPGGLVTGAPGLNTARILLEIVAGTRQVRSSERRLLPRVRRATWHDLATIVLLEHVLFKEAPFIFTLRRIRELYEICPEAFLVAETADEIVGYAVLFALTQDGATAVAEEALPSITELDASLLHPRLDKAGAGLYLEVVAASSSAPLALRATLLRHLLGRIRTLGLPTFTFPYTTRGRELANRLGFRPVVTTTTGSQEANVMVLQQV